MNSDRPVTSQLDVLIASYLDQALVDRIAATDPRVSVHYHPDLLPAPRWVGDHAGIPPALHAGQHERWSALLAGAQVMFDFDWRRPEDTLAQSPRLRWVQATSAGVGARVEALGLRHGPLTITTASGVHAGPLAEFVLAGILYFARRLPDLEADRAERIWREGAASELAGRNAVVVGAGRIGTRIAEMLKVFGVTSTGVTRRRRPVAAPFVEAVTSEELPGHLHRADILIVAAPITDQTQAMIAAPEIAALPDGAVIVNVGRGATIDEHAMIGELRAGRLRGAVLDVTAVEPLPTDSALWSLDNVILSPHTAANVPSENAKIVEIFTDNLRRYLRGEPLRNVYDHDAGY
ncbi:D-2-hydroxyacid dehydrogenase [Mycobacterium sp. ITM-2016-00317]|uniref:D-2-hydroxyacid dehydrogenase n=1 Tax=Mycobacterium sp. ITM-2016-00317 TaxID=2099694 RepID=UPI000D4E95CA|nr:D-2-hydroxyacid dehydrogenase [Mycobacterium sp. ITM-2016-00317]WNG87544.1 D-2-hydroxyacid dehydrogenase [Mycobacterium sp. ITM-2016-00317]